MTTEQLPSNIQTLRELIVPMPGKIVVLIDTKEEITPQGLLIPVETARSIHEERPTQGEVIAIGDQDEDDLTSAPSVLSVGDRVVFAKFSGTKISWQPDRRRPKESVVILSEKDILCKIRSAPSGKLEVKV